MSPVATLTSARSVLITGCSNGGIGSALTVSLSKHPDVHIYASARNIDKMSDLASLPNVTLLSLDVTSPPSIDAAFDKIQKTTGGKLDYLVNNAGSGYTIPYLDTDLEVARKMFEVNVWGPMRVTQAF